MADLLTDDSPSSDIEACPDCGGGLELYLDEQLIGRNVVVRIVGANCYEITDYDDNPAFEDAFDPDSAWSVICSGCSEEVCSN